MEICVRFILKRGLLNVISSDWGFMPDDAQSEEINKAFELFKSAAQAIAKKKIDHWQYWKNPPEEKVKWVENGFRNHEFFFIENHAQEIMGMEEENNPDIRTVKIGTITGDVVFDNVSFSYEAHKEVLHHISFEAPSGSVTALVGSSGSGKSTIAGLAATFLNPNDGVVSLDGIDLSKVNLNSFRKHLGVVLQDDFLYEGTIRENILFPRPNASESQLLAAVKGAYVDEFTDRFEDGLDTVIGERGVKLSGGQRQRISIARALLADPKVIILDEATSNLDTESESYIQKSLNVLMKDRTTFVIAHRLSTIQQANQILVIENGNIVERGKHDALIAKKGRYFDLYTYQSRI